jgi:hypothetical protein
VSKAPDSFELIARLISFSHVRACLDPVVDALRVCEHAKVMRAHG